jgi:hypothetical protein
LSAAKGLGRFRFEVGGRKERRLEDEKLRRCGPSAEGRGGNWDPAASFWLQDYAAAIDVEGRKLKQRAERKKKVKARLL